MRRMNIVTTKSTGTTRKQGQQAAQAATGAAIAPELSAATSKLLSGIRDDFGAYRDNFTSLTMDRATFAPKFMRVFDAWAKETGGNFVGFVRQLDPKVPEDRDGYKAHPSYAAADNLRRLNAQAGREQPEIPEDERPVSMNTALVYLVATVMPFVDPNGSIFAAFAKQMNWTDEQAQRIKERAAKLGAVKLPPRVKHSLESHSRAAA
jgi:hypothetical protein